MRYQFEEPYNEAPYNDTLAVYCHSFIDNFTLPALTDYVTGKTMTYGDMARRIARLHLFFQAAGIKQGDKIALLGKNTPNWVITFMATITYGAVIVPVLHDFNSVDATHIIDHSGSVILFVADGLFANMDFEQMPQLRVAVSLDSRTVIAERTPQKVDGRRTPASHKSIVTNLTRQFRKRYPGGFTPRDIKYPVLDQKSVAVINYTSGTTGFSKGVMLTLDNLRGNIVFGIRSNLHYQGSRALSFLPLAHAYGCAFDMLVPLAVGSHVTLLGKTPTPMVLLRALKQVRPNLIICVPLILEKIYRKVVVPMITKKPICWVLAVPGLDKAVYSIIRSKLVDAFGGAFEEVIVGGAALNSEVEEFLSRIKFPFTVGYGMTECGPLISYDHNYEYVPGSCGQVLKGIMEVRIDSDDPYNKVGEIQVRGENVMKGYYKNEEATKNAFTEDGWLHTGDLGTIDADNRIFIRGRSKTMILGASGQNIYPEEIESKINNLPFVMESIVIEKNGKLVALVYPDYDTVDGTGISHTDLPVIMEQNRVELNKQLASYEVVSEIQLYPTEFEKTPKKSIKRYLYSNY